MTDRATTDGARGGGKARAINEEEEDNKMGEEGKKKNESLPPEVRRIVERSDSWSKRQQKQFHTLITMVLLVVSLLAPRSSTP